MLKAKRACPLRWRRNDNQRSNFYENRERGVLREGERKREIDRARERKREERDCPLSEEKGKENEASTSWGQDDKSAMQEDLNEVRPDQYPLCAS